MSTVKYLISGVLIGISNIIPGISGGTIAVLLGVYDRLIIAIVDVIKVRNIKSSLMLIIPITVGVMFGIKGFATFVLALIEGFYVPIQLFFVGLILGSIPSLLNAFKIASLRSSEVFILLSGIFLLVMIDHLTVGDIGISAPKSWMYFGIGVVAAASMIVPGLSGSLIMMILGMYESVLVAINLLQWQPIFLISIGALIGGIGSVFGIKWLLVKLQRQTHVAVLGLVMGSVPILCPPFQLIEGAWLSGVIMFLIGVLTSWICGSLKKS
jgi:putative membrane protein